MDDFHVPGREALRAVRLAELVAPYGYDLDPARSPPASTTSGGISTRSGTRRSARPRPPSRPACCCTPCTSSCPPRPSAAWSPCSKRSFSSLRRRRSLRCPRRCRCWPSATPWRWSATRPLPPGGSCAGCSGLHGLERYFSAFFFSDEHGFSKPDRRAFLTPLAELGIAPHEAVHVGDIQRTDIDGAQAAGLRAVHFVGVNSSDLQVSTGEPSRLGSATCRP